MIYPISLRNTCFLLLLIFSINTFSQSELATRYKVEKELVLLKNEKSIIPIKHLESSNIALIRNTNSINYIEEMLEKYAQISRYNFDEFITTVTNTSQLKNYSTLIIALYNSSDVAALSKINIDNTIIVIAFSEAVLKEFLASKSTYNALILAQNSDRISEEYSAQIIFGGLAAKGVLNTSFLKYPSGHGLTTTKTRLKYTVPEEEKMNSLYINTKVDSIMRMAIQQKAFPGAQLLVAKNNSVIFHKTYGYHTYDSLQKVELTDLYDMASVTKITGPLPALMKLYDDKVIDLDKPFSSYWKSWNSSNDKKNLTVREILAHQSGLSPYIVFLSKAMSKGTFKSRFLQKGKSNKYSLQAYKDIYVNKRFKNKMYRIIKRSKVSDKKKYKYSGLSFLIYPKLIEQLTNTSYQSYLQSTFYKPLGAYTLGFNPSDKNFINTIVPTENDTFFRNTLTNGWVHDENAALLGGVSGNAGLFATATDMAKIMQMYMQKGEYGGQRFFSAATVNEFIKVQFPKNNNRRGLGFDKPLLNNAELTLKNAYPAPEVSSSSFGHSGFTGTFVWADPEKKLVFIFLSNRVYPTRANRNLYSLNIRPLLQQVFYKSEKK